jgi:hypothetical protein
MMKVFYLALTLIVLSAASMNAQVTIGSLDNPHPGAVLDLHSNTQGCLLPTVSLNDVSVFQLATDTARATGMTVYNTNPAIGEGIFVWDGRKWKQVVTGVSAGCSDIPETPGIMTLSTSSVARNETFTADVEQVTGETYTWHTVDGLTVTAGAGTHEVTIQADNTGNYPAGSIWVEANNDCGTSLESSASTAAVTVIAPCSGYQIPNGVYTGPVITSGLPEFTVTGQTLCVAPSDISSGSTWATAVTLCENSTVDGVSGWRLPNIGETCNSGQGMSRVGLVKDTDYWTGTISTNGIWGFRNGTGGASNFPATTSLRVRCVRVL